MKSPSYFFIALMLVLSSLVCRAAEAQRQSRPNVIAIDDQGRWAMGLYGNRENRTPNMDRIGKERATFSNAIVATLVHSPGRAACLTGDRENRKTFQTRYELNCTNGRSRSMILY